MLITLKFDFVVSVDAKPEDEKEEMVNGQKRTKCTPMGAAAKRHKALSGDSAVAEHSYCTHIDGMQVMNKSGHGRLSLKNIYSSDAPVYGDLSKVRQ